MAESGNSIDNSGQKLTGKVAIITGGASGIGEETARVFANHGARMVVIADIQDELGTQVAASIGSHRCRYIHCDVSEEEEVKRLVEETVKGYGQLDVMFSNAGVMSPGGQKILELDLSLFDRLFAVNARGMAACVKHAARSMTALGVRGSIICTASVSGSHAGLRHTDYVMSKHAVKGLMRSASTQLGPHGIRVNCVSPSGTVTPLTRAANAPSIRTTEELQEYYAQTSKLKGFYLSPSDVAHAVLFLASDDSRFVSGHDLAVDGCFARA
ncbi:hypothetical protein Fmac_008759 [Flemingia macrophylla]|uniref:Ketoreductase domain-containing protein n=1 Tax=Flemingia macrophylla TaxID=520843 RepID=A0ABD1MYA1_9FABA